MRALAAVLVILACLQVALAGNKTIPSILKGKLVKGVLVKGAKHAMQSSIGAGAGLAASALSGLPVTTFEAMSVPANFSRGYCRGNSFCFPKYRAAIVEKPTFQCGYQYTLNHTKLGAACIKRTYTKMNTCFKSIRCPARGNYTQTDEICLPTEVRNAMVGMLTVFKVKATLPFMLLPSLKKALAKAVLAPIILPKSLLLSMAFNATGAAINRPGAAVIVPELDLGNEDYNITVTHPADLMKLAFDDLSQAGEGVMKALVNGSSNPLEIVTKGILNCNVSDIVKAVPEINEWVASKLQGLGNISDVGEPINETFPSCFSKCCRPESHRDTALVLPTAVCPNGTIINNLLGLCVGGDMGYAPCPGGFSKCSLPNGVPLCLSQQQIWGMESCKVAGLLMHNLPKHQCPHNTTDAYSYSYSYSYNTSSYNTTDGHPFLADDQSVNINFADPHAAYGL